MNKNGQIKKHRYMKEIPVQLVAKVIEVPFRVYKLYYDKKKYLLK